jgi:hypothetical protein
MKYIWVSHGRWRSILIALKMAGAGDFERLSWSGMAWAGAARQTAITMSRFVGGIFSAKGRDHRREDAQRVSRKGTLSWFWQCFRVVTHNCHAITIAAQDQPWLHNIAQQERGDLESW